MSAVRNLRAAVLVLAVLLLASCGATTGDDDGRVVLRFQSLSDQPAAIETSDRIVAEWNRTHPDVQVEVVQAGWDGVHDKLITQFNALAAPDVVHYEASGILPFAADGYLADLTPYLSEERRADIPAGVLDSVTVDGEVVAYPTAMQSYVVYANRTMLREAGVEIPTGPTTSWDELRAIAKATTGDDRYGLAWGLKDPTAAFMSLSPGFGGLFFGGPDPASPQITVGAAETALPELVADMTYQDGSILPVSLTQSGSKALAPFYEGQVAMTVQGSFQTANIAADAPEDLDWVVLPPLAGPAGAAQAANPQTLSIAKDSPHVAEAAEFLEFFTRTGNLAALNEADGLIPATVSARDELAGRLGSRDGWDVVLAGGRHLTAAPFLFADRYQQWKETVATPAYQRFLAGQTDADELARELELGWNDIAAY
ncbi:extracellular solute-binding protein [Pseudonocardia nematodicida]|uniref:Extracellular solute-binding protein n=1 Tax=Pseudonocardia nematodicida TaxID=1206997 RepID=A0ABV1KHE5_9PSEU